METTTEHRSLTERETLELWRSFLPLMGVWIAKTIRTMGLPALKLEALGEELRGTARKATRGAVRLALLKDTALHEDIIAQVWSELEDAAKAGRAYADYDSGSGFLVTVVRRTTQRVCTRKAKELLRAVTPVADREALEQVTDLGADLAEHVARREKLACLRVAISELSDEERELVEDLSREASGKALAAKYRATPEAMRTRISRLRAKLRKMLGLKEEEDGDEK